MANLVYSVPQDFYKIDAISTQGANYTTPADPLSLQVITTAINGLENEVENVTHPSPQLQRVSTGVWLFKPNEALYNNGETYEVRFRYYMTVDNLSVKRKTIVFNKVPENSEANSCVVYGTVKDTRGVPIAEGKIVVETYKDYVTLNTKLSTAEIYSNGFGHWYVELERGSLVRFVLGDYSKTIVVPDEGSAKLGSIAEAGMAALHKDKYGYPY